MALQRKPYTNRDLLEAIPYFLLLFWGIALMMFLIYIAHGG